MTPLTIPLRALALALIVSCSPAGDTLAGVANAFWGTLHCALEDAEPALEREPAHGAP